VRIKYSEQYEYEQISNLLGMDKKDGFSIQTTKEVTSFLPALSVTCFRLLLSMPNSLQYFGTVGWAAGRSVKT